MSWECRFNLRRRETDIYLKNVGTFPKQPFEIPLRKKEEGTVENGVKYQSIISMIFDLKKNPKKFFICSTRKKYSNSIPSGVIEGHPKQWQHTSSSHIFFRYQKGTCIILRILPSHCVYKLILFFLPPVDPDSIQHNVHLRRYLERKERRENNQFFDAYKHFYWMGFIIDSREHNNVNKNESRMELGRRAKKTL